MHTSWTMEDNAAAASSSSSSSSSSMADADQQMIQELFHQYDDAELAHVQAIERDVMGSYHHDHHHDPGSTSSSSSDAIDSTSNSTSMSSEEGLLQDALKGFHEALLQITTAQKKAYNEALKLNPRVVAIETPPERYLQACGYNFWMAADRLTKYWTIRKEVFRERFHLPLDLSGNGALPKDVVESLKAGHAMALAPDLFHRTTLLFDVDRKNTECESTLHRTQVYWYMVHVATESKMACTRGTVVLMAMSSQNKNIFQARGGALRSLTKEEIWPGTIKAVHFCFDSKINMIQKTVAQGILAISKLIMAVNRTCAFGKGLSLILSSSNLFILFFLVKNLSALKDRIRVHYFSANDIQHEMGPFGITRNHLPDRLGGTLDEKAIAGWFQWRLKVESERYAFLRHASDDSPTSTSIDQKAKTRDRGELLKRTMDEVYLHNKAAMEQRRVKKLKKEQSALREEGAVLEAHVKWMKGIAANHARQRDMIMDHLKKLFNEPAQIAQLEGIPASLLSEDGGIDFSIDHRILECCEYLGRHVTNGLYMFQTTDAVYSLDPQNRLLMNFLLSRIPLDLFDSDFACKPPTDLNGIEHSLKQQNQQRQGESDEDFYDRMKQMERKLRNQHAKLNNETSLLDASVKLSHAVVAGYERYQESNIDVVAEMVNSLMHSKTGIDLRSLFRDNHYMYPHSIARRLLSSSFMWMGSQSPQQFSMESVESMLRAVGYLSPIASNSQQQAPNSFHGIELENTTSTNESRHDTRSILSADERRQKVKSRRKQHLRRL